MWSPERGDVFESRSYEGLVGSTLCLLGSWSDIASQGGHGGVCVFRDVIYMLSPRKVVAYGDSLVF